MSDAARRALAAKPSDQGAAWRPLSLPLTSLVQLSPFSADTLEVLHSNHAERIRLTALAAQRGPSLRQASETIADVILPDGMNLNQDLVKQGWCWWYRKYVLGDTGCWKS